MKRILLFSLIFICWVMETAAYGQQEGEEILKSIVKIRATIPKESFTANTLGTLREGNGVVIDLQGHILTTGYLIIEAETIEISIQGEEKPMPGVFVGYDHATGFGLLRTQKPTKVKPIKIGKSELVKEGTPLLIAAYGGKEAVQVVRVISRKEFAGYWEYLLENPFYTVPAFANYGGAALINQDGQLVGIGSLLSQIRVQGFGAIPCNISIPIDLIHPILDDLKTKSRPQKEPRPWLGINAEEVQGRVFITRIISGGPAEKAGLKKGDLVLSVKGKEVKSLIDFYRQVWALGNAGIDVPLLILQGIQIREIIIKSSDRYQFLMLYPRKLL